MFEELFVLTCGLAQLKDRRAAGAGRVMEGDVEKFAALLPFPPTGAQRRAMEDIAADLRSGRAMNRLVQGDVGSGKTAVAAFGAWAAVKNGAQCALMAPTELLAEQHARTMEALLAPAGVRVALLTGSVKGRAKKAAGHTIYTCRPSLTCLRTKPYIRARLSSPTRKVSSRLPRRICACGAPATSSASASTACPS